MKKLKEILLRLFKYAFIEINSTYFKEKRRHKRCGFHFKKSLILSEVQKLVLLQFQSWADYFKITKVLIAIVKLIKTLIMRLLADSLITIAITNKTSIRRYFYKEQCQKDFRKHMYHSLLLQILSRQAILIQIYRELSTEFYNISKQILLKFCIQHQFLAYYISINVHALLAIQKYQSALILFVKLKVIVIPLKLVRNSIPNFDQLIDE